MKEGLIGVIVPVYKVEKYIAECIESILAQTYTNFRLILVDDGTPDNAGNICDEYAKKDSRITVIHQVNAGVTRARARGVEEANDCEFIMFVDSDDSININTIEELSSHMTEDTDIVINERKFITSKIKTSDYIHALLASESNINTSPWSKLYRRKMFNCETFNIPRSIVVGEDLIMNVRLCFSSNKEKIAVTSQKLYNYRYTEGSISTRHTKTSEYEYLFHKHLIKSIPKEMLGEYINETIKNRLQFFMSQWGFSYNAKGMKSELFYQSLNNDINKYKYHLPFIDNTIFRSSNTVVRFLAITIKKIRNKYYSYKKN